MIFARNLAAACVCFVIAAFAVATGARTARTDQPVPLVICNTFGRYCAQALRVSWCESRWSTSARNGQYVGIFQMGSYERRRYGNGHDAISQARAAFRYFRVTGRDWSPWTCRYAA